MKRITKTYEDVPKEALSELLKDLQVDLRDVPHDPPQTTERPGGKYNVEVTIGGKAPDGPGPSGSGRYG
jgi:hypothetical protein